MTGWMIAVAAVCVVWAIVAGLSAVGYCRKHGISVNFLFLRIEMLKCLSRYRTLTRAETGHVGPFFYHYVISINIALALILILVVIQLA